MIGIFDSGIGGLTALKELRRLAPRADITYLADRKNAPYGTKTESELTELVTKDIELLRDVGADRILIACCTASTVHGLLPEPISRLALPIIEPAAFAAANSTKNGRIGVIATKRTVAASAFGKAIRNIREADVTELEAQHLVSLIENGERDGRLSDGARRYLTALLLPFSEIGIDTLVLGCTHFPHLSAEIGRILPNVRLISPSREGARALLRGYTAEGQGRTIYL